MKSFLNKWKFLQYIQLPDVNCKILLYTLVCKIHDVPYLKLFYGQLVYWFYILKGVKEILLFSQKGKMAIATKIRFLIRGSFVFCPIIEIYSPCCLIVLFTISHACFTLARWRLAAVRPQKKENSIFPENTTLAFLPYWRWFGNDWPSDTIHS